jgi:hypothetical protein
MDMEQYTRTQMIKENRELLKKVPSDRTDLTEQLGNLEELMKSGQMKDNLHEIRKTLVKTARETISNRDCSDVMFRFIKKKHHLRQAFRLYKLNDPKLDYDTRKKVLKPFETVIEAYMLKRCTNGFSAIG